MRITSWLNDNETGLSAKWSFGHHGKWNTLNLLKSMAPYKSIRIDESANGHLRRITSDCCLADCYKDRASVCPLNLYTLIEDVSVILLI